MSEKSDKLRAMLEKEKERRIKLNNRIEILERRISMFRNPFGRVRSSCSARHFRPENWTERH